VVLSNGQGIGVFVADTTEIVKHYSALKLYN